MKRKGKSFLSLLLSALMVLTLLPTITLPARAATTLDVNSSGVTISSAGDYIITGTGTETANRITVNSNISGNVNITLNGVNINVSGTSSACAFDIGAGTTVNAAVDAIKQKYDVTRGNSRA